MEANQSRWYRKRPRRADSWVAALLAVLFLVAGSSPHPPVVEGFSNSRVRHSHPAPTARPRQQRRRRNPPLESGEERGRRAGDRDGCEKEHRTPGSDRRSVLVSGLGPAAMAMAMATAAIVLRPEPALAGIDVSGLRVESNPLDVFLGGTYYEDLGDDSSSGSDGRIAGRKYFIEDAEPAVSLAGTAKSKKPSRDMFENLGDRYVLIRGESTAISSSQDDALVLTGKLALCGTGGGGGVPSGGEGCITVDLSPLGGSSSARGYWDASDRSIRFVGSSRVWSKQ